MRKYTKEEIARMIAATEEITRDLFARGGPQRPSPMKRVERVKPSTECPALLAEQQRLIKTWNEGEKP